MSQSQRQAPRAASSASHKPGITGGKPQAPHIAPVAAPTLAPGAPGIVGKSPAVAPAGLNPPRPVNNVAREVGPTVDEDGVITPFTARPNDPKVKIRAKEDFRFDGGGHAHQAINFEKGSVYAVTGDVAQKWVTRGKADYVSSTAEVAAAGANPSEPVRQTPPNPGEGRNDDGSGDDADIDLDDDDSDAADDDDDEGDDELGDPDAKTNKDTKDVKDAKADRGDVTPASGENTPGALTGNKK